MFFNTAVDNVESIDAVLTWKVSHSTGHAADCITTHHDFEVCVSRLTTYTGSSVSVCDLSNEMAAGPSPSDCYLDSLFSMICAWNDEVSVGSAFDSVLEVGFHDFLVERLMV